MVRDVSREGIFLYSDFAPAIGSQLNINVVLSEQRLKLSCQATVVRVEQISPGAAPGIAARLQQPMASSIGPPTLSFRACA
jgi:hypothetical protein